MTQRGESRCPGCDEEYGGNGEALCFQCRASRRPHWEEMEALFAAAEEFQEQAHAVGHDLTDEEEHVVGRFMGLVVDVLEDSGGHDAEPWEMPS